MNKATALALLTAAAFGAGAVVLLAGEPANADRTVILLTGKAEGRAVHFYLETLADGGTPMPANICGRTQQSDGGLTQVSCYDTTLAQGNAINTAVRRLFANDGGGQALDFWKAQEGL